MGMLVKGSNSSEILFGGCMLLKLECFFGVLLNNWDLDRLIDCLARGRVLYF